MRLLKLGVYPAAYLREFYARRESLALEPYAVQHEALIEDCFGSSDFWTCALGEFGYETADTIADAEFLQAAWARENDFKCGGKDWLFEISSAQIKKFRPDVLLVADYSTFTAEFLRNIRRECPSIRLVLGWCGAPYGDSSVMREWDAALSCVPEMVEGFRREGIESFHVNHAFAPRVLEKLDLSREPNVDFAFVGSIVKQSRFHTERERLLIELVEATNLQIRSDAKSRAAIENERAASVRGTLRNVLAAVKSFPRPLFGAALLTQKLFGQTSPPVSSQFVDERILRRTGAPVFGVEMFQTLRDARLVFNNHIDISPRSASNMRLFEATGVGACLLTDWKENLSDLFEPDAEVLTYKSAEECVEKARYILGHEDERRAIARAGQARTLRVHTFENRAAEIDKIIRRVLPSNL